MAEYINLELAISVIEEKQRNLCPMGKYGRSYAYGSDDFAPVVYGKIDTRHISML